LQIGGSSGVVTILSSCPIGDYTFKINKQNASPDKAKAFYFKVNPKRAPNISGQTSILGSSEINGTSSDYTISLGNDEAQDGEFKLTDENNNPVSKIRVVKNGINKVKIN
jgi:hypothetical protein